MVLVKLRRHYYEFHGALTDKATFTTYSYERHPEQCNARQFAKVVQTNERSPILRTEQYGSSVSQAKSAFDPICTIKIIESIHRKR